MRDRDAVASIVTAFLEGARPRRELSLVDWAEKHVVLDSRTSRLPGTYQVRHSPYCREILETLSPDSPVAEVAVMKAAQLGLTLMAHIWLLFLIDQAPSNIFTVMPTVDDAKDLSKTKFDPLVEASELIRSKIQPARSRDSGNTIMMKEFPGGAIMFAGANSPGRFRSRSGPWLLLDDLDGYPAAVKKEGDPVTLAKRFTTTFPRRKHLYISTPTIAGHSRIEAFFQQGDRSRFFVPCPRCGAFQTLFLQDRKTGRYGLRWEGNPPERAWYECAECKGAIEEGEKELLLERGVWRAEAPRLSETFRSFHLSQLYSPPGTVSWKDIATRFLAEKGNPEAFRTFVNHVLGETWEEQGDAPDWELLYARREPYKQGTVPKGGLVLTAGADVQRDRIEVEVVAWGPRLESWSVWYDRFPGDVTKDGVWRKLDELLARTFRHESGVDLKIRLLAVDANYETQHVHNWVRSKAIGTVIAVQGADGLHSLVGGHPSFVDVTVRGRKIRRGAQLWRIGVSVAKRELYSFLRTKRPAERKEGEEDPVDEGAPIGRCHFPEYGEDHFKQLTAEQLVWKRDAHGFAKSQWHQVHERNEALDCRVYARAAAAILGIDRWTEADWARALSQLTPPQSSGNVEKKPRPSGRYGSLGLSRWHSRRDS